MKSVLAQTYIGLTELSPYDVGQSCNDASSARISVDRQVPTELDVWSVHSRESCFRFSQGSTNRFSLTTSATDEIFSCIENQPRLEWQYFSVVTDLQEAVPCNPYRVTISPNELYSSLVSNTAVRNGWANEPELVFEVYRFYTVNTEGASQVVDQFPASLSLELTQKVSEGLQIWHGDIVRVDLSRGGAVLAKTNRFRYLEAGVSFVFDGEFCNKHEHCESRYYECVNNKCEMTHWVFAAPPVWGTDSVMGSFDTWCRRFEPEHLVERGLHSSSVSLVWSRKHSNTQFQLGTEPRGSVRLAPLSAITSSPAKYDDSSPLELNIKHYFSTDPPSKRDEVVFFAIYPSTSGALYNQWGNLTTSFWSGATRSSNQDVPSPQDVCMLSGSGELPWAPGYQTDESGGFVRTGRVGSLRTGFAGTNLEQCTTSHSVPPPPNILLHPNMCGSFLNFVGFARYCVCGLRVQWVCFLLMLIGGITSTSAPTCSPAARIG